MTRLAPLGWIAIGGGVVAAGLFATGALRHDAAKPPDEPAVAAAGPRALSPSDRHRAGVRIAVVAAGSTMTRRQGYARALDVGPLATIDAERQSAAAAVALSRAELRRLQMLYAADQSASLRSVETARAQAAADRVRLGLATRRTGLEFGSGLAQFGGDELHRLIDDVAVGRAALVRIDISGAALRRGQTIQIGDDAAPMAATVLGAAAMADAKLQSSGALAVVRGPAARDLSVGRIVPASVSGGATQSGVIVPRAAIVRWQGARWVFRQRDAGFERVELVGGVAAPDGWLATQGLMPGDRIAVEGAGSLLAIELGNSAPE